MIIPIALVAATLQGAPDSLTLAAALELARAHRGQVTAAAAAVQAARAEGRAAAALPNPIASYSYTGDAPRQHATIDQPLDWLLRRGSELAWGRAGVAAAVADSQWTLAQVEREARVAFYGAMAASRRLTLAEDELAIADSLAALAVRRLAAGEIAPFEEAQAALEAARARRLVSSSREAQIVAVAELGRALGVPADSLAAVTGALDADLTLGEVPALAPDRLPQVVSARADSAAAHALFRASRWARVPFPSLQAGVEWDNPDVGTTILLGVSVPFPLWQSGGAEAAAAGARAAVAAARLREAEADARRQVSETATRVRESARRALVSRDSVLPLAERQRDLALVAYRAGETGIVPVLEALRAQREVARELVDDLVAYQAARADWIALRGGSE